VFVFLAAYFGLVFLKRLELNGSKVLFQRNDASIINFFPNLLEKYTVTFFVRLFSINVMALTFFLVLQMI
jgi:hypothetical protein